MIGKLAAYVLRNKALVLVGLAVFVGFGIESYRELPVEAYPDVTNVEVQVITLYPGHAAEEVERQVTIPIESVMNGIPGRVSMRSVSLFGLSQITLVFEDNADDATIRNLANQLLAGVTLPAGANASLSPDATPIGEVYRYTLTAPPGFPASGWSAWSRPRSSTTASSPPSSARSSSPAPPPSPSICTATG